MNPRNAATLVATLLAFSALPASADRELKVRGLFFKTGIPGGLVHAHNAGDHSSAGVVTLKSFLNHEFDTLSLSGDQLVFTMSPDPSSVDDPASRLATCSVGGGDKSVILTFVPAPAAESTGETVAAEGDEPAAKPATEKYRVLVAKDDAKSFPPGSVMVVNGSSAPVKIELENETFEFKPAEIRLIARPPVGESGGTGMKGFYQQEDKWLQFGSGIWPGIGKKRVLQLLTEDPVSKQVKIRGIRDVATPSD